MIHTRDEWPRATAVVPQIERNRANARNRRIDRIGIRICSDRMSRHKQQALAPRGDGLGWPQKQPGSTWLAKDAEGSIP